MRSHVHGDATLISRELGLTACRYGRGDIVIFCIVLPRIITMQFEDGRSYQK